MKGKGLVKLIGQIVAILGGILAILAALSAFINWYAEGKLIDVNQDNKIDNLASSIDELTYEVKTYTKENSVQHKKITNDVHDIKKALILLMHERRIAYEDMPYKLNYNFNLYDARLLSKR